MTAPRLVTFADPLLYRDSLSEKPAKHKRILGLDLGTSTGVAFADVIPGKDIAGIHVFLDQWDLSLGTYDSGPLRLVRLRQFLSVLQPDMIGFEDVKYDAPLDTFAGRSPGEIVARVVPTAEFLGGLKAAIGMWSTERQVPLIGYAITAIKKRATGRGNANKEEMIAAANKKFQAGLSPENYKSSGHDNIADAMHVLSMTIEDHLHGL